MAPSRHRHRPALYSHLAGVGRVVTTASYDLDMTAGVPDGLLDMAGVAKLAGVEVKTIAVYLARKTMPEPDYRVGRSPLWKMETIDAWLKRRPGKGWRGVRPGGVDPATLRVDPERFKRGKGGKS
jgi:predicted DNA-binding transcriptional regulator AlpA